MVTTIFVCNTDSDFNTNSCSNALDGNGERYSRKKSYASLTVSACASLRNGAHAKTGFHRGRDRACTAAQAKDGLEQTGTFSFQPLPPSLSSSGQLFLARLLHSIPTWTGKTFLQ